jgi:hypothetical protein
VTTLSRTLNAHTRRIALFTCVLVLPAPALLGQQPRDSARAAVDTSGAKPEIQPPISPRRAFLYSLMIPGYGQSVLGRGKAGTFQIAFEAATLVMIRQSAADIREAKRTVADSIPVSYVDANGAPKTRYERTGFPSSLIKSRRAHLEDWIAVLLANHLFAAADAYVAALLWDLPSEVALRASPRSAALALRLYW